MNAYLADISKVHFCNWVMRNR